MNSPTEYKKYMVSTKIVNFDFFFLMKLSGIDSYGKNNNIPGGYA